MTLRVWNQEDGSNAFSTYRKINEGQVIQEDFLYCPDL